MESKEASFEGSIQGFTFSLASKLILLYLGHQFIDPCYCKFPILYESLMPLNDSSMPRFVNGLLTYRFYCIR
jgi:hypothetical protein